MAIPTSLQRYSTVGGVPAVVFTDEGGGEYPLIGAYFTGVNWIPSAWTVTGKKFGEYDFKGENTTAFWHVLDLIMEDNETTERQE